MNRIANWYAVLVALLLCTLPALAGTGAPAPSPTPANVTWEVYDSSGNANGYVVSETNPEGPGFTWRYYEYPANQGDPANLADSGTAQSTGSHDYTWQSTQGGGYGTVQVHSGGKTGSWTNTANGTSGTLKKL